MQLFGFNITRTKVQSNEQSTVQNYINLPKLSVYSYSYYDICKALRKEYLASGYGDIVKNLIDSRVSIIGGAGYDISSNNKNNIKFIEYFKNLILPNDKFINILTIGEIDGRILVIPEMDETIQLKVISNSVYRYTIQLDQNNYLKELGIDLQTPSGTRLFLQPGQYVKVIMSGLEDEPNLTCSRVGSVYHRICRVNEIMERLANQNDLFGLPRIENQVQEWQDGIEFKNILDANSGKWGLGDLISNKGKIGYIEPSGKAAESLLKELYTHVKFVSSITGISVDKMGFVDLFGTKAGLSEMAELSEIATRNDREKLEKFIRDLAIYCMKLDSKQTNTVYDYEDIYIKIPISTISTIERLADTYINLMNSQIISKQTCRELIPNVDAESELKRIEIEKGYSMNTEISSLNQATNTIDIEEDNGNNGNSSPIV